MIDAKKAFNKITAGLTVLAFMCPAFAFAQTNWDVVYQPYGGFFDSQANYFTGIALSYYSNSSQVSSNPAVQYGAYTYDSSLRILAQDWTGMSASEILASGAANMLQTYAANFSGNSSQNMPDTYNVSYTPSGGTYEDIRFDNYEQSDWYDQGWDWGVYAGPTAWIGNAAIQKYLFIQNLPSAADRQSLSGLSAVLLQFAEQRANYLIALQDTDGGIRYGSKGQYSPNNDTSAYWNRKSTENNESTLAFFDNLYKATGSAQYKITADSIYAWLKGMFDKTNGIFSRGENLVQNNWVIDGPSNYAPDTTNWAPVERMLNDSYFGNTKEARLLLLAQMARYTQNNAAVVVNGAFKGISFSPNAKTNGVISIEWTSQLALFHWRLAQEYLNLISAQKGIPDRVQLTSLSVQHRNSYTVIMASIGNYFQHQPSIDTTGKFLLAPYAVFTDGSVAGNQDTGQGWLTPPQQFIAAVAPLYYLFAELRFDPLTGQQLSEILYTRAVMENGAK